MFIEVQMTLPQVMVLDKMIYRGPFHSCNCLTSPLWELINKKVMEKPVLVLLISFVILRMKCTSFSFSFFSPIYISKVITPVSHLSFDDDLSFNEISQYIFDFLIIHEWLCSRCLLPVVHSCTRLAKIISISSATST